MQFTGVEWTVNAVTFRHYIDVRTRVCGFCDCGVIGKVAVVEALRHGAILYVTTCVPCFEKYIKPEYPPAAEAAVVVAA